MMLQLMIVQNMLTDHNKYKYVTDTIYITMKHNSDGIRWFITKLNLTKESVANRTFGNTVATVTSANVFCLEE